MKNAMRIAAALALLISVLSCYGIGSVQGKCTKMAIISVLFLSRFMPAAGLPNSFFNQTSSNFKLCGFQLESIYYIPRI
jgi:hypothetical protein